MARTIRFALIPTLLAGWLLAAGPARAQVRDEAGFFSAGAVQKADAEIQTLKQRYHQTVLVETFKTVPESKKGQFEALSKDQRRGFFRQWAKERARANGVDLYVLVNKSPGHVEVEEQ